MGISYYDWDNNETEVYFRRHGLSTSSTGNLQAGDATFTIEDGKSLRINAHMVPISNNSYETGKFDPRIQGIRCYMKHTESRNWDYFMFDFNFELGYTIERPGGDWLPFRQLENTDHGLIGNSTTTAQNFMQWENPPLLGYNELNSWDGIEPIRFRYKTSTVIGQRQYIGNVAEVEHNLKDAPDDNTGSDQLIQDFGVGQYKIKNIYPDRMMKSPVGQLDVFPKSMALDASISDGDEIIHLDSFGRKLLQFRRNILYIIDVSQEIESFNGEFPGRGIDNSCQICKTPKGLVWINNSGVFAYNGQNVMDVAQGRLSRAIITELFSYDTTPIVGYVPDKDSIVIMNSYETQEIYLSLKTNCWYTGKALLKKDEKVNGALGSQEVVDTNWDFSEAAGIDLTSNIVNLKDGRIAFIDANGLSVGGQDLLEIPTNSEDIPSINMVDSDGIKYIRYESPDIDFAFPTVKKKIYKVVVRYKFKGTSGVNACVNAYWGKDGESALEAKRLFSGVTSDESFTETDGEWNIKEFKPGSNANNIDTFSFGITTKPYNDNDTETEGCSIMIDYITIFYKMKGLK
jgi:hypothetical protein